MAYTDPASVRRFCGLTVEDAPDAELNYFIEKATKEIILQISSKEDWEIMSGKIDGSNKEFYTAKYPIADADGDKTIEADDVTVYTLKDRYDITTLTEVSVSSIDPKIGKVTLTLAPPIDTDVVVINYRYYETDIDWALVEIAASLLAGYYFALREYAFIPEGSAAQLRVTFRTMPFVRLKEAYDKLITTISSGVGAIEDPRQIRTLAQLEAELRR